jgi:hypothetical protein
VNRNMVEAQEPSGLVPDIARVLEHLIESVRAAGNHVTVGEVALPSRDPRRRPDDHHRGGPARLERQEAQGVRRPHRRPVGLPHRPARRRSHDQRPPI